jgi:hypothetical protein
VDHISPVKGIRAVSPVSWSIPKSGRRGERYGSICIERRLQIFTSLLHGFGGLPQKEVHDPMAVATHNIVGTFYGQATCDEVVRVLENAGIDSSAIFVDAAGDETLVTRAEMREEVEQSLAGPGISLATKHQAKGAMVGTAVGTVTGAVVGLMLGAIALDSPSGVIISVGAFAIGGATAGFVAGGLARPRPIERRHDRAQENRIKIGVHSDKQEDVERAQSIFDRHQADRVERFDSEGNPVPELHGRSGHDVAPSRTGRRVERRKQGGDTQG